VEKWLVENLPTGIEQFQIAELAVRGVMVRRRVGGVMVGGVVNSIISMFYYLSFLYRICNV